MRKDKPRRNTSCRTTLFQRFTWKEPRIQESQQTVTFGDVGYCDGYGLKVQHVLTIPAKFCPM